MMNKISMTKIVGIILIIIWISQVPYLFPHPFQEHKGAKKLVAEFMQVPDWIKQESSIKAKTADELEKNLMTELRINWIKSAFFIVMGVLSGWWLIQRRKRGYLLAFFFSLLIIGMRFNQHLRFLRKGWFLEYHELMLRRAPVSTIHDILMQLVLLGTVIFIIYIFMTRKPEQNTTPFVIEQ